MVAEHERITVTDAYLLPVVEYLNTLAYLKAERDYITRK
jgi:hypothetical protein